MDLPPSNQQEATASSSNTAPDTDSAETKTLRSSARVKAAKQKSQGKDTSAGDSGTRKRTRDPKGKAKQVADEPPKRRTRRNATNTSIPPLTINEPVKDPKGKKRAAPEVSSDDDRAPGTSTKRPRTRSQTTTNQSPDMPRKTKSTAKGKMAVKAKALAAAGSSQQADPDIEMTDAQHDFEQEDHEEAAMDEDEDGSDEGGHPPHEEEDDGGDDDDHDDGEDEDGGISGLGGGPAPGGLDEAAALAIFGDYRQFGSYMMSLSSRLKTMLNNIKMTADPTTRLLTLQELSELLSISTEDTLAGSFQVEQFVKELVKILGGRGEDEDDGDDGDGAERESGGPAFQGDENLESQVLAARCLANLMEALPGVAHTVVYHGAIPVLCSKLIEISYIDLAEQTLSTMEKISEEFPSAIVREGGLSALLNYLDFFSIAVQRTALQAASNCCRNVSSEHFPQIRGVWPIIRNCLTYSDQRLVEFACLCVIRVIDSYHRSSVENLESLVDTELIRAVLQLLLPAGGSPMIAANTFTLLLRALATSARASPKITVALLEADIVDTLYQILTGVLPSMGSSTEQGGSGSGQGLGGGVADMTVMENLAHRPKDQIEETLSLISELMPPLPKDGVFDYKSYTEKALLRMIKAKAKADRAAARAAAQAPLIAAGLLVPSAASPEETPAENDNAALEPEPSTAAPGRTEILRSKHEVVARFMQFTVPILIDVYAASVNTPVRVKALTGLLKAVSFLDAEGCQQVLKFVPVASFASSILSSKDQPQLVIGALQLVDLLLGKDPTVYKATFRREGVFHEIEQLSARNLISSKSKEKADKDKDKDSSEVASNSDSAFSTPAPPPSHAPTIPGYKKLSSMALDPDDAITLRSRIIKFKYLNGDEQEEGDSSLSGLKILVERIDAPNASEEELTQALWDLANLFASPHTSISSFEMIQSGLVDGLLRFTMDTERKVSVSRRKELLLEALLSRRNKVLNGSQTPFSTFVKKLQESLTRLESFDVVTVSQSSDGKLNELLLVLFLTFSTDSKRSSPSLLARQLRLRLVADEESGIPRTLHNIVVSIHAIATFQALHDYLRPRVSGLLGGSSSRLSGMLAALAASGFAGPSRAATSSLASASDLPPTSTPETSGTSETSGATITRRRSQRLSAKNAPSSAEGSGSADSTAGPSTSALAETSMSEPPAASEVAPSDTLVADFTSDEEVDAEVFEDEDDPDNSIADKTVTLSVAEGDGSFIFIPLGTDGDVLSADGSKVEAQTPDGTRVATPAQRDGPSASSTGRLESSSRPSYAAALKQKPSDWHLEFAMDDHILPLDLTIYGAIHQHEMRKKSGPLQPSMLWQGVYTIKFKKVPGPIASTETDSAEAGVKARSASPTLSCLAEDAPHAKILRLLRVLHKLNTLEAERSAFGGEKRNLPETAFVNNKLTAKLTRQLEEPMIVASSCLPDWALDLPQHFPFLFPFATRYNFLQSTSFGYARLILKWQSQQNRGQDSSRRDDGIGFLGRLHRQKVRISRKHILESAVKVFELYGSSSSVLEVEYFEEVGTGLGPTLEFYSLVSKEFARKDLKIWRDADHTNAGTYVNHPSGLYPAPLTAEDIASDGGQKKTHIFRVIGQFVAKAMLDSRIIDLSLNKIFLKLILGEEVPLTIVSLKVIDVELANSLAKVLNIATGNTQSPNDKVAKKIALLESVSVEDLALDFTLPGYDIDLRPGGKDIAVTSQNAHEYVQEVLDVILGKGAQLQAKAFREGFSKVFPISDLQPFSVDELVMLFGNADEDWSIETLSEALKADHGFHPESRAIRDLMEIMSEYDPQTRREYLQFITGSPKLPIGGFRGLNPPLTVVRKPYEAPLTADDYLPSVMTCVNYLKLPEYSSKAVMKEKIRVAIKEGIGSFHLS
ncbi:ubiquitin-protein ligase [Moniliophthora roreri]|nr:ubiquitin-protein ligase [Moniliophthora roreri]